MTLFDDSAALSHSDAATCHFGTGLPAHLLSSRGNCTRYESHRQRVSLDTKFEAAVETYPQLRKAIADRRRQLGLTQLQVDAIAGLQDGYTGKIEAAIKHLGEMSLECLLGTLGLKIVIRTAARDA